MIGIEGHPLSPLSRRDSSLEPCTWRGHACRLTRFAEIVDRPIRELARPTGQKALPLVQ